VGGPTGERFDTAGRQWGDNVMIGGIILGGADYSRVIFRGLGPSIPVADRLADPVLELHDGNGSLIQSNDDWKQSQGAEIQASGLAPANDREAAIIGNFRLANTRPFSVGRRNQRHRPRRNLQAQLIAAVRLSELGRGREELLTRRGAFQTALLLFSVGGLSEGGLLFVTFGAWKLADAFLDCETSSAPPGRVRS
jgi:hypothetical protein